MRCQRPDTARTLASVRDPTPQEPLQVSETRHRKNPCKCQRPDTAKNPCKCQRPDTAKNLARLDATMNEVAPQDVTPRRPTRVIYGAGVGVSVSVEVTAYSPGMVRCHLLYPMTRTCDCRRKSVPYCLFHTDASKHLPAIVQRTYNVQFHTYGIHAPQEPARRTYPA